MTHQQLKDNANMLLASNEFTIEEKSGICALLEKLIKPNSYKGFYYVHCTEDKTCTLDTSLQSNYVLQPNGTNKLVFTYGVNYFDRHYL